MIRRLLAAFGIVAGVTLTGCYPNSVTAQCTGTLGTYEDSSIEGMRFYYASCNNVRANGWMYRARMFCPDEGGWHDSPWSEWDGHIMVAGACWNPTQWYPEVTFA